MARIRFDCRRPHVHFDPNAGMARRTSGGDPGRPRLAGDPFLAWPLFCRAARLSDVDTGAGSTLASAKAAEDQEHGRSYLMLVGAFAMIAASIKPSGMLLLLLPFSRGSD
jgi:hypothetical protein